MAGHSEEKKRKKEKRGSKEENDPVEGSSSSSKKKKSSHKSLDEGHGKGKGRASSGRDEKGGKSDGSVAVLVAPEDGHAVEVGAVLIGATDFTPPQDMTFTLHHQPGPSSSSSQTLSASLEDSLLLSGETGTMDIVGWNWDLNASMNHTERRDAKGYSGEYLVGVYDPDQQTVTLRAAPMFTLRRSVKALNSLSINASSGMRDYEQRMLARRGLGEAFGNRKTKAKARAEDRMKVDTTNMLDIMDTLQDNIESTKSETVSLDTVQLEAEQARPIPPLNTQALVPQEAYPLQVLIPDAVFRLLSTRHLEQATSKEALTKLLPGRVAHSSWLKDRMWSMVQSAQLRKMNGAGPKTEYDENGTSIDSAVDGPATGILKTSRQDARTKLKVAFYVALLWGFLMLVEKGNKRAGGDKEELLNKLRLQQISGGEQILDDLFLRFCETQRGIQRGVMSNFTQAKLYAYLFALTLHMDDFSVDPAPLARDLAMAPTKVTDIFRSLGCSTANKSVTSASGTSSMQKRIILKCPVELPKPRKGRKT